MANMVMLPSGLFLNLDSFWAFEEVKAGETSKIDKGWTPEVDMVIGFLHVMVGTRESRVRYGGNGFSGKDGEFMRTLLDKWRGLD